MFDNPWHSSICFYVDLSRVLQYSSWFYLLFLRQVLDVSLCHCLINQAPYEMDCRSLFS